MPQHTNAVHAPEGVTPMASELREYAYENALREIGALNIKLANVCEENRRMKGEASALTKLVEGYMAEEEERERMAATFSRQIDEYKAQKVSPAPVAVVVNTSEILPHVAIASLEAQLTATETLCEQLRQRADYRPTWAIERALSLLTQTKGRIILTSEMNAAFDEAVLTLSNALERPERVPATETEEALRATVKELTERLAKEHEGNKQTHAMLCSIIGSVNAPGTVEGCIMHIKRRVDEMFSTLGRGVVEQRAQLRWTHPIPPGWREVSQGALRDGDLVATVSGWEPGMKMSGKQCGNYSLVIRKAEDIL